MRRLCLTLCLLLAAFTRPLAAAEVKPPAQFQLANGLQVVVVTDTRAPIAIQMLWYKAGSIDEPPGKTGIAHMLEHMMFRGTKEVPAGEFANRVARLGGVHNAFTNTVATGYFQRVAKHNLAEVMRLEADRMHNLVLSDALFWPERNVVLEERHMRTDSVPQRLFYEQVLRRHYSVSPFGNPVIGWQKDIEAYTPQDARDWYQNYYAPNNAVLVLIGDLTVDEGRKLAETHYGAIPPRAVLRRPVTPEPERFEPRRFVMHNPDAPTAIFQRIYRAPSRFEGVAGTRPDDADVTALMALQVVLGHPQTGLLHQELVVRRKLADSVHVHYDPVSRGETPFVVEVHPKPDVSLDVVEKAVDELMGAFMTNGPAEAAVARAVTTVRLNYITVRDDPYLYSYHLARWLICGGTAEGFSTWEDGLPALTPADLLRVARAYLRLDGTTTAHLVNTAAPVPTATPTAPAGAPAASPPPPSPRQGGL
jgi:zinc protease